MQRRTFSQPTVIQRGDAPQLVPLYEHFGSEELTRLADPIQERMREPYAVLNGDDASRLRNRRRRQRTFNASAASLWTLAR